jgi:hypothetical protein
MAQRGQSGATGRVGIVALSGLGLSLLALGPHELGMTNRSPAAGSRPEQSAAERDTVPEVASFRMDGSLEEWESLSPQFRQAATHRAPAATVWVGSVADGLALAGVTAWTAPEEGNPDAGLRDGRQVIVLRLVDGSETELPPIGWGHQFGFEALEREEECDQLNVGADECRDWFRAQGPYRRRLRRLFRRTWVFERGHAGEVEATAALGELDPLARRRLALLEPAELPRIVRSRAAGTGAADPEEAFEILIPWEAFPPIRGLVLSSLRLGVELRVSDPAAEPPEQDLEEAELLRFDLARPRQYVLTPCEFGLENVLIDPNALIESEHDLARRLPSDFALYFMQPSRGLIVRSLLVVDNEAEGYLYWPEPTTISPAVFQATFFARELRPGETLCGPIVTYKRGEAVSESVALTRVPSRPWEYGSDMEVEADHVEWRELPDGDLLLKEGPRIWYSPFGSGQCGACPRVSLELYRIDRESVSVHPMFAYYGVDQWSGDPEAGIEIEVSDDWQTVTVYQGTFDYDTDPGVARWTAAIHCVPEGSDRYEVCEERDPVPPPERKMWTRAYSPGGAAEPGPT